MKGKITNDFADMVDVNSRLLQKIDLSIGSSDRSELTAHVTTGDIRIAALETAPVSRQRTASTAGSE